MAIAFDAASSSSAGTGTLSWTHTPVGTPKGVWVSVLQYNSASDEVTGVTYGGVAMTETVDSPNGFTSGESVGVYSYFLGSAIPTGAQTVEVSVSAGSTKQATAITVTAAADTEIQDTGGLAASTEGLSGTLALGGNSCFCAHVVQSASNLDTSVSPPAGWTERLETDFGTEVGAVHSYDTVGTSDVTFGGVDSVVIAKAITGVAIKESAASGITGTLNQTTETDTAQPVGKAKYKAIGQASTTDAALTITPAGAITAAVGQVVETDLAQAVSPRKIKAIGQASESGSAQAITAAKAAVVGQATETDAATAMSSRKTLAVGLVTETEFAQAIAHYKAAGVLQVVEADSAHSITAPKYRAVAQVAETDVAIGMTALGGYMPPFEAHPIRISFDAGYEKMGVRAAYADGAPGLRMSIYNQTSDLMFAPGSELVFSPLGDLMFGATAPSYPGIKLEVVT